MSNYRRKRAMSRIISQDGVRRHGDVFSSGSMRHRQCRSNCKPTQRCVTLPHQPATRDESRWCKKSARRTRSPLRHATGQRPSLETRELVAKRSDDHSSNEGMPCFCARRVYREVVAQNGSAFRSIGVLTASNFNVNWGMQHMGRSVGGIMSWRSLQWVETSGSWTKSKMAAPPGRECKGQKKFLFNAVRLFRLTPPRRAFNAFACRRLIECVLTTPGWLLVHSHWQAATAGDSCLLRLPPGILPARRRKP